MPTSLTNTLQSLAGSFQTGGAYNRHSRGVAVAGRNDAADVIRVDMGVELYEEHGLGVTRDDILQAIVAKQDEYLAAQQNDPMLRFLQVPGEGAGY